MVAEEPGTTTDDHGGSDVSMVLAPEFVGQAGMAMVKVLCFSPFGVL